MDNSKGGYFSFDTPVD